MTEPKFVIKKAEGETNTNSVICEYTDKEGNTEQHYFVDPHHSLQHVDLKYIRDRWPNARHGKQVQFIRDEYDRQITEFVKGGNRNGR